MLPSDLVFSPVISESETLGFFWKSNQRLLCTFKHPVRRGSPPCLLTPHSGHWGAIPYKSLGSTQQQESLFILAGALKHCDNTSSTPRPEHSSPRFSVLILVLLMNSPGGSRNFPTGGWHGARESSPGGWRSQDPPAAAGGEGAQQQPASVGLRTASASTEEKQEAIKPLAEPVGKEPRWFKIHRGILKPRLRNKKAKKKRLPGGSAFQETCNGVTT